MPNTRIFKSLSKRFTKLRHHFLPRNFSITGNYSARQLDRALAYRFLVHAEIEYYIEEAVKAIVVTHSRNWASGHPPSNVLFCLVTCFRYNWDLDFKYEEIEKTSNRTFGETVKDIINTACSHYHNRVSSNNGIREDNLKVLLSPIGIEMDSLDQVWVNDMDSYGKLRGNVAHKGAAAQQPPDPRDELNKVNDLLVGLKQLDEKFYILDSGL